MIILGELLRSLGYGRLTKREMAEILKELDLNGDGDSEGPFEHFSGEAELHLRQVFSVFDRDQDGFISASDLREVMRSLGAELSELETLEMIREADVDEDGMLDFTEFALKMQEIFQS